MEIVVPSRRPGETASYEEDPFDLGVADDQVMMVVPDFLPMPEVLILKEHSGNRNAMNKDIRLTLVELKGFKSNVK